MRHSPLNLSIFVGLLLMTGVLGRVIYEPSSGVFINDPEEAEESPQEDDESDVEDDTPGEDDEGDSSDERQESDRASVDDKQDLTEEDEGTDQDDVQQLITLSNALADESQQRSEEEEDDNEEEVPQPEKRSDFRPSPPLEGILVTPVDDSTAEEPLESVVNELRKENAILRSEVRTLMEALSNSAKVIEAKDNEEDKKRFTENVIQRLIDAEKLEEILEEEDDDQLLEPVTERDIEDNEASSRDEEPMLNKRTEEVFGELAEPRVNLDQGQGKGQCAAVQRLTDGCRSLADRYHLTMDDEARDVCSAHQLCYACAYPDREAMGGCDVIYRKQTGQMCSAEDTEDPKKCNQEAEQLLGIMQLEHTQASQQHTSNMEEGELRAMCEAPCSLAVMLLK